MAAPAILYRMAMRLFGLTLAIWVRTCTTILTGDEMENNKTHKAEPKESGHFLEGLGEDSCFYKCHPLLNFTYFTAVIGVIMFANHPVFLAFSLLCAWAYSLLLRGRKALGFNIGTTLICMLLIPFLNMLNVHNGVTVLFYLNGNRVTAEAMAYGFVLAAMITGMLIWFSCFQTIVTADKFIYLFGRFAPGIALTLSMVFRFIPLLQERFREISAAQRCMGRKIKGSGVIFTVRQAAKEISILIAWSLEASIETADSMESRGYGLRGRTSLHLYKLSRDEAILWIVMLILTCVSVASCIGGVMSIFYYPKIILPHPERMTLIAIVCYGALLITPLLMDWKGRKKWK